MEIKDRKINSKELSEMGLVVDGVEILPPCDETTLAQLRIKRKIPFTKLYGRIYYQVSELIEWEKAKKVSAVI
ncbi:MAG: hypothetical protein PHU40_06745 [Sulfurimonas sp.]|nr:hypothetical protein [Sulfurimonas sp.]